MGARIRSLRTALLVSALALTPLAAGLAPIAAIAAPAAAYPGQQEGDHVVENFKFASGESLDRVKLHYTTLGMPHRGADGEIDNAVLVLHGTTGTGKSFLIPTLGPELFGEGAPLDARRWYVILPD
ncbi:MAG: hypothetical protein MIN69_19115, partial [Methylorubrum extorquens]